MYIPPALTTDLCTEHSLNKCEIHLTAMATTLFDFLCLLKGPIPDIESCINCNGTSLVAQMVKNLPAMQEASFQSPSREDPLEKGMATHSSILAWKIPWTEETGGLQPMGS